MVPIGALTWRVLQTAKRARKEFEKGQSRSPGQVQQGVNRCRDNDTNVSRMKAANDEWPVGQMSDSAFLRNAHCQALEIPGASQVEAHKKMTAAYLRSTRRPAPPRP